jgi:predicted homoserine dehydrogenase-like protein
MFCRREILRLPVMPLIQGKPVITNDIDLLLELKGIDVIVEATGTIEFAMKTILKAFDTGIERYVIQCRA